MIAVLTTVLLITASDKAAAIADPAQKARVFMEAYFAGLPAVKDMLTNDALLRMDDNIMPYAWMLPKAGDPTTMTNCRVEATQEEPTPPAAELERYQPASFHTPGRFALVTVHYTCPSTKDGTRLHAETSIYLKDGLVVLVRLKTR